MRKIIIFLFLIILSFSTFGVEVSCSATKWPYQVKQSKSEYHKILNINKYESVLFYYFYEISSKDPVGIENDLFVYLKHKSPNRLFKGFIEALNWGREKGKRRLDINEICDLYRATVNHPENNT